MSEKLNCILLVDDDEDCNFFHKKVITKRDCTEQIEVVHDGDEALQFLKTKVDGGFPNPALIFLDINMPKVNGWEFLELYDRLDPSQKAQIVIVMLTTSLNVDDEVKARGNQYVKGFVKKYLTAESLDEVLKEHFPGV